MVDVDHVPDSKEAVEEVLGGHAEPVYGGHRVEPGFVERPAELPLMCQLDERHDVHEEHCRRRDTRDSKP